MTTPTSNQETALVLGLSGAIGSAVAKALVLRGWTIRALTRLPADQRPRFPFPVDWRGGDALDATSVAVAAAGATLIIHGVNPPGFQRWREDGDAVKAALADRVTSTIP